MKNEFAKDYATALFELSIEENKVETIFEELNVVSTLMLDEPQFMKMLSHPELHKNEKKDIFKKVFKQVDQIVLYFLYVLVDNNRIEHIQSIQEMFIKLYNEYNKVIEVKAQSTLPLNEEQKNKLEEKLKIKYRHKIKIENVIDKSIIGGLRLSIDNEIIDFSLKSQFSNLKSHVLKQT